MRATRAPTAFCWEKRGALQGQGGTRLAVTGANRKLIVGGAVALACLGLGFVDGAVNHAFALRDLILGGVGIVLGSAPTTRT